MQDAMKLYEKLRQPEFDKRRNDRSLSQLLDHRLLDIARPFAPWRLPDDPTWNEDPHKDDTWGLYFHSLGWMAILDHGIDSAGTTEQREFCARELRRLFFSYLGFLRDTDPDDLPKMAWFDHATAWRASAAAYFFEKHFKDGMSETERGLIEHFVQSHAAKLKEFIDSGRWNANNHGLFHAEALWDMSKVFALLPPGTDEFALAHMRTVFSKMIDFEEGVCREQSIYYHLFDASLLVASAGYMGAFGVEVVPGYRDILARMLDFYYDFCADGEFVQPVGDTQYGKPAESRLLEEIAASISYQRKEMPAQAAEPALKSYPQNGYYFFRSDDANSQQASVILLDKPYAGAHGHSDGASILLSKNGEPFLVDSGGPFAYGKGLRFEYFKAAEAHNVALVGGKSAPYLTRVTGSTGNALGKAIRIDTQKFPPGRWHRTLVAVRGGSYLLIDHFSLQEPDSIDVAFHLAPEIGVTRNGPAHHRLVGTRSTLEMFHASNVDFEIAEGHGPSGFPRGLVTRELGKFEPSPVLTARLRSRDAWLATLIGPEGMQAPLVHSLYGGKLIRVMIDGPQGIAVDCGIDDSASPVKVYSFRPH
jgi:hypothetical protein